MRVVLICIISITMVCCESVTSVMVDTISGIDYIEPERCELRKINSIYVNSQIENNKIVFSNRDFGNFLNNIIEYKFAVEDYVLCQETNENYYKNIINILIDKRK